ncbi:hypothetical protein N8I77_006994 [Diaporthe amygdali]|uniref:Tat pathway signal sequence n=1 Tax=Phomopsis amygdali TaxID=1214568 RepID=A0AAD9SAG0_PHOAM|nr:hypothetical protein N8I77_006994 [Diaporthe amygdali]
MISTRLSLEDEAERTAFMQPSHVRREEKLRSWRSLPHLFIILTVLNIIASGITTVLVAIRYHQYTTTSTSPNDVYRRVNGPSPLYDEVHLNPYRTTTNGTFWPADRPDGGSIARHMPNPADEAIWDDWELTTVVPVTSAGIRELGKDPSTAAKLENSVWGLGDDAYAAVLDVFHQIHCLNQLRKFAYADYYHMKIANADPEVLTTHEVHTNHCVDILLQAIQCSGNLQLVTMHWTERQRYPFPDMSTNRQCVDFDRIKQWRDNNRIDTKKFIATMGKDQQPSPVKERPAEKGYLDMFGA